jgi:hypothetical protein
MLTSRALRAARGTTLRLAATLTNEDPAGGVTIARQVELQGPPPRKAKTKARRTTRRR